MKLNKCSKWSNHFGHGLGGHMILFADAFFIESGNSLHNQDFFNFQFYFMTIEVFSTLCEMPKLNGKLIINGFLSEMEL